MIPIYIVETSMVIKHDDNSIWNERYRDAAVREATAYLIVVWIL